MADPGDMHRDGEDGRIEGYNMVVLTGGDLPCGVSGNGGVRIGVKLEGRRRGGDYDRAGMRSN